MPMKEERDFTLRVEVCVTFADAYEGDADGYAWWPELEPALSEIVRAAAEILRRRSGGSVRPANRGRPTDEEVTLIVERHLEK